MQLNGAEILGHHIVVERDHLGGIQVSPVDVNEDALRAMVKRLLAQVLPQKLPKTLVEKIAYQKKESYCYPECAIGREKLILGMLRRSWLLVIVP